MDIVKPPKQQPIQDVLSVSEVAAIINATRQLRYQIYYLTTYSLGLRLSESLNLKIADTNGHLMRVHLLDTKSKKDRFVPLPQATLPALRAYWKTHRHLTLIFPSGKPPHIREGKTMVMDKGGVQKTNKLVAKECGISKKCTRTYLAPLYRAPYVSSRMQLAFNSNLSRPCRSESHRYLHVYDRGGRTKLCTHAQ